MNKIAEFIYYLNSTVPTIPGGVFSGVWDAGVIIARLKVDYKTKVKLEILPAEIADADPEQRAIEFAEQMERQYKERMSMPLMEGKT
jgi:hypothetical protein